MANQPTEFKSKVLLVLSRTNTAEIRVTEYEINGRFYKMLEKRALWVDEQSNEKYGKTKGFNLDEVKMLEAKMLDIYKAFGEKSQNGNPTPLPAQSPVAIDKEAPF